MHTIYRYVCAIAMTMVACSSPEIADAAVGSASGVTSGSGAGGDSATDAGPDAVVACSLMTKGAPCLADAMPGRCFAATNGPSCCTGCVGYSADAGDLVCYVECPSGSTCTEEGVCVFGL